MSDYAMNRTHLHASLLLGIMAEGDVDAIEGDEAPGEVTDWMRLQTDIGALGNNPKLVEWIASWLAGEGYTKAPRPVDNGSVRTEERGM